MRIVSLDVSKCYEKCITRSEPVRHLKDMSK
jgi:hypothetical protein